MRHPARLILAAMTATLLAVLPAATVSAAPTMPDAESDFDGDNWADLVIGVPGENTDGARDSGAVNVLYGGSNGLSAADDQSWSQASAGVLGIPEGGGAIAGDGFGSAIASGDFNWDGYDDLAIGVPLDRVGTVRNAGAVNVLYGSAHGLTASNDDLWNQGVLPDDPEEGDGFGQSLTTGDFNGDVYDDLAVGAPGEILAEDEATGSVTIIPGGPNGLTATGSVAFTRAMTGEPFLEDSPNGFGYALAAGDLNSDFRDDLAIGAPASGSSGDDPLRPLVDGEVSVLYGTVDGLSTDGSQLWTQDSPDVPGEGEGGDWFGASLAIGNFNDPDYDDLAVGVRFDKVGDVAGAGAVNIFYGSGTGLTAEDSELVHQDTDRVPDAAEQDDFFGWSVAIGDMNLDGYEDLAVGVPGEAIGAGEHGAGLVHVIYATPLGLNGGSHAFSQGTSGVPGVPEASESEWDAFGASVTVANFGISGRSDLAVGVPLERLGSHAAAGMVNVLYGRKTGMSTIGAQGWSQDSSGVKGVVGTRDYFGAALGR